METGHVEQALAALRVAVRLEPSRADLHYNTGVCLTALGSWEEALAAYRRATQLKEDFAEAHQNFGHVCKLISRLDEAEAAFRRAAAASPDWFAPQVNLAGVYEWQARHEDAVACHRKAMALAPADPGIHGNYLYTLLFHPAYDAAMLKTEHARWSLAHARASRESIEPHCNDRRPRRRLRVGYLSGFFRDHVVGRNLLPLLREHDPANVETFCYSTHQQNDWLTDRFRSLAAAWRDIGRATPADAAGVIRADGIDILVDTMLHMEGGRLLVFARKPAPVQISFAGYPGSTGLESIDYRLTDPYLDPPGMHDECYSEQTVRLPDTFWCYDPLEVRVAVNPLPCTTGRVTFGCLNNFSKVNAGVLELWAAVLRAVPESRLLLLAHEGSHRERALSALAMHGIEKDRVSFAGYRPRERYLELFHAVDVSLDTVPYNGHTTNLDSLWMGVPVVTLVGRTVVGRAGLSQLMNLGLPELIARSPDEYVAIAAKLATDTKRLQELRQTLRVRMERSSLMDAGRFARSIEAAYRELWQRWCAGGE